MLSFLQEQLQGSRPPVPPVPHTATGAPAPPPPPENPYARLSPGERYLVDQFAQGSARNAGQQTVVTNATMGIGVMQGALAAQSEIDAPQVQAQMDSTAEGWLQETVAEFMADQGSFGGIGSRQSLSGTSPTQPGSAPIKPDWYGPLIEFAQTKPKRGIAKL